MYIYIYIYIYIYVYIYIQMTEKNTFFLLLRNVLQLFQTANNITNWMF